MLLLFDIDGTLIRSGNAGIRAMEEAGRELVGEHFSFGSVSTAGGLDPLIWHSVAERNGVADPAGMHETFRARYGEKLTALFQKDPCARALPGAKELVAATGTMDGVTRGLLTGNYPETGRLKLRTAGIEPDDFAISTWGDEADSRRGLPPLAMLAYHAHTGQAADPERTIIIGDTPHDIDCARVNGCRVIAVATGGSTREDLETHEPDLLVDDLSDVEGILGWLRG